MTILEEEKPKNIETKTEIAFVNVLGHRYRHKNSHKNNAG